MDIRRRRLIKTTITVREVDGYKPGDKIYIGTLNYTTWNRSLKFVINRPIPSVQRTYIIVDVVDSHTLVITQPEEKPIKIDYKAAAEEIHRKLDKLGLSNNPNYRILIGDSIFNDNGTNCTFENRIMVYSIDIPSSRFLIMSRILFGGKLDIKFKELFRRNK